MHDQKAEKLVGKELVRRFFDLTYNQLRFDEAMGYFEPAGTWEDFSFGKHFGKAAVRSMLGELGSGFPKSLQAEILVITGVCGDKSGLVLHACSRLSRRRFAGQLFEAHSRTCPHWRATVLFALQPWN